MFPHPNLHYYGRFVKSPASNKEVNESGSKSSLQSTDDQKYFDYSAILCHSSKKPICSPHRKRWVVWLMQPVSEKLNRIVTLIRYIAFFAVSARRGNSLIKPVLSFRAENLNKQFTTVFSFQDPWEMCSDNSHDKKKKKACDHAPSWNM